MTNFPSPDSPSSPNSICPKCGSPLELNSSGSCPVCLLHLAAQPDSILELPDTQSQPSHVSQLSQAILDINIVQKTFPQLEIIEQIGRGGMGTVFKARQPKLDRFVALKILSEQLAEKPTFAERFAQEGKLLARLNHPNIVAVFDFGRAETTDEAGNIVAFFFLILEFVDGVNLRQAMREERFSPEQALAIVPKICEALQYAHEEGVLHRDIKPENILLDTKGRVKIADFGIARFYGNERNVNNERNEPGMERYSAQSPEDDDKRDHLTQTGVVLGTPSYMAPEQLATPGAVDHRADIYSLGVVFYELLTGELPRESLGQWSPPSEKTPVGAEIDGIVLKALHRDRNQRHQSAGELKTEIETAAKEQYPINELKTIEGELKMAKEKPTRRLAVTSLVCMVFAILIFVVTAPMYYQICKVPLFQARQNHSLYLTQKILMENVVESDRQTVIEATDEVNRDNSILNQVKYEVAEETLKINEKWLEKRKNEEESARLEYGQYNGQEVSSLRGIWFWVNGLPVLLAIISLVMGFSHLKRLRASTDKTGIVPAGLVVLMAPFLIPVFIIITLTLCSL